MSTNLYDQDGLALTLYGGPGGTMRVQLTVVTPPENANATSYPAGYVTFTPRQLRRVLRTLQAALARAEAVDR